MRIILIFSLLIAPCCSQTMSPAEQTTSNSPKVVSPLAVIPFKLVRDHIFVEATIDKSRLLSMFIDSGEAFSAIDSDIAKELKLSSQENAAYLGIGNDERTAAGISKGHELRLGDVSLKDVDLWIIPVKQNCRLTGQSVDGVIGADLFVQYMVEIDYASRCLRLYSPDSYTLPHTGHMLPLTFLTGWMVPLLQSKLTAADGSVVDASLVFDTGSGPNYLAKSLSDAHPYLIWSGRTLAGPKGAGTNGSTAYLVGRLREIQLGELRIKEPLVLFSLDSKGISGQPYYSGSIGGETLEGFTIIVDYKRRIIVFRPNDKFGQHVDYNMSGFHILSDESDFHHFEIDFVATDSVAAQNGISVGDIVVSINGKSASKLTLDEIDQMLVQPGEIKLKMLRAGKKYKAKLKLSPRI